MHAESPEGQSVGVVKNLLMSLILLLLVLSSPIYDVIEKYIKPLDNFEPEELYGRVKIIVNGNWIGIVDEPITNFINI